MPTLILERSANRLLDDGIDARRGVNHMEVLSTYKYYCVINDLNDALW